MSKIKTSELEIGQNINVDIYAPDKGTFPVGRYGGLYCKVYIPKSVGRIEYGCTCLARVTHIRENSIEVRLLEVIKSAAANNQEIVNSLANTEKYHEKDNKKHPKNRPFLDKLEQLNQLKKK